MAKVLNKCGKRKCSGFFHVAEDGTRTRALNLAEALEMARTFGGSYEKQIWRE